MIIHFAGHSQGKVLQVSVVWGGNDGCPAGIQNVKNACCEIARRIHVLDHFKTDDHRKGAKFRPQVIAGRAPVEMDIRVCLAGNGDSLLRRVDSHDLPAMCCDHC